MSATRPPGPFCSERGCESAPRTNRTLDHYQSTHYECDWRIEGTSIRGFSGGTSLHLADPDLDLFRRPTRVSVNEIDALLGLRPLRDDVLGYLLGRALQGHVPVYFAAIPRGLIRPFDSEYDPAKHPVGAAAIEHTAAEWRAGNYPSIWVYPSGDAYVLSDDYIPWAAALRGKPQFLPCWVLGYPSVPGAVDINGPIEPERVRRLLGIDDRGEQRLETTNDAG